MPVPLPYTARLLRWTLFLSVLVAWGPASGQDEVANREIGNPLAEVHSAKEYNAHGQNFAIVQDKRGLMYFGNFAGVLEYDGTAWRTITTTNYGKVSSLYLDNAGRIFVGANGEFGYLKPDAKGTLNFASLSERIATPFGEIISIVGTQAGIYFIGKKDIYLWNKRLVRKWHTEDLILSAYFVQGQIYFYQKKRGLGLFDGNKILPVTLSPQLPALLDIVTVLPYDAQNILVATSNQGLFKISNNLMSRFNAPANGYLSTNQISSGLRLDDNTFAMATLQGGIALLDRDGRILQIVRGKEFEDTQANSLFQGRGGVLWLALNNGIAQVDIPSPMSVFDEAVGVKGAVNHLMRYRDRMYVGTLNGLYILDGLRVGSVGGLNASCFYIAEANGALLAATSKGIYRINGTSAQSLSRDFALCLHPLRNNPRIVFVGLENGLGILDLARNSYRQVPGIDDQIVGISEDNDGHIWLETLSKGLYRTDAQAGQRKLYTKADGLSTLLYNKIVNSPEGLIAWNKNGTFRYSAQKDAFEPHNLFQTDSTAANYWKGGIVPDQNGNFWTTRGDEKFITYYKKSQNGYQPVTQPFRAFSDRSFDVIYPDADSLVWFGGPDGAIRFDLGQPDDYLKSYPALLRKINLKADTLAFNGYRKGDVTLKNSVLNPERTRIAYALNDISFAFSATSFNVGEELVFKYILENYDDTWSDWTAQNRKEYTNLAPGRYRFRVKAKNIYELESEESVFEFVVAKPWYLMWWAYLLYFIVLTTILYFLIRWRLRALVKEKDLLESMIQERTEEIFSQKEELEEQSQELGSKNDQLEKIDQIVQSINSEIEFTSLFETVLARLDIIRNMESATALIYDQESSSFRFKAAYGNLDLAQLEPLQLTLQQAEERYLNNAVERAEDVYARSDAPFIPMGNALDTLAEPKSLITIVINVEGHVEGFITLENTTRANAFDQKDFDMIRNLKEHLIAAFIKTKILENLETTLSNLKVAQDELIRQERLASVGQLTRGIVDRILNPLNYINNFSESSNELIEEIVELVPTKDSQLPAEVADDYFGDLEMLKMNLVKIKEHGNSTTRIVKDMQRLLKEKSTDFLETDLNTFLEGKAKSAYQELRSETREEQTELEITYALEIPSPKVRVLPTEMGSVIGNIISNSYYSTLEREKVEKGYLPQLQITSKTIKNKVVIRFKDNGKGVPKKEMEQMFSPFFTTKPTSKGTGLGLYMSKDIVELHRGLIEIESEEGQYAEVIIMLPTY
ncbi:ATP-binding protein [Persicitalea sp.]|uniref:sensor histidine kinase n=1 Tax=Persicitalea sp. TaxID=3100273 RepID=UPI00359402D9